MWTTQLIESICNEAQKSSTWFSRFIQTDTNMAAKYPDAQSFQNVLENLTKFSETATTTVNTFSGVYSEVFHIPLNDRGSTSNLKVAEYRYGDDFASHLKHLRQMCCSVLETADENFPITLEKLKIHIGKSSNEGEKALEKVNIIDRKVVQKSIEQISELKNLASEFKIIKEDQKKIFEPSGKKKKGSEEAQNLEKTFMSKMGSFLVEVARKELSEALFESNVETDPEKLLNHLETIEESLLKTREVTNEYQQALRTVNERMKEIKQEEKVDVIVSYVSEIKDKAGEIVKECDRIKTAA